MAYKLSSRSIERMDGLHPDLVAVIELAIQITPIDFTVLEGLRTKARQKELVASGASKTMNSRHLTGHAIDIAPFVDGKVSWNWSHYYPLAEALKRAAEQIGVNIEWGGDWTSFKDGPHWQLSWSVYGKHDMEPKRGLPADQPVIDPMDKLPADARALVEKADKPQTKSTTNWAALASAATGSATALSALDWRVALPVVVILGALAFYILRERKVKGDLARKAREVTG